MLDRIKIIVYFLVITFSVFLSSLGRMYLTTSVISFAAPSQIKLSYSQVKQNYIIYNINPYFFILHSLILATAVIIFAGHNVGFGFPLSDFTFSLQHYQQRLISIFTLVYCFCLIIFIGELFHKHNILNTIGRPLRYRNRTVAAGSNSAVAV